MTRLIEVLISLAIVAALFIIVGFLLPSHRHIEQSVETNRKMTIVYDTINSFARFSQWNVLPLHDPAMDIKLTGPKSGEGAQLDYSSKERSVGSGSWKLVNSVPGKSVTFEVTNDEPGTNKITTFKLEPSGRGQSKRNVRITQTYDVDYGMNLFGRYAGMYVSSGMGESMKMSLGRLSNLLAAVPNHDYNELSKGDPTRAPSITERPAANLLLVSAAVERNNDVVERTMKNNLQWIEKVMKANNLEAAGPVRVITNEFGSDSYAFDVAMPVRKAGGGSAAKSDAAGDAGSKPADAVAVAPADAAPAPAGKLSIKLEGPVEHVYDEPAKVAMVPFTGHMANLPTVRDALRAWVLTQGLDTAGRPYESWDAGIEQGFLAEGEFRVYWMLR
ncbi:MAG: SRPBCC family protein [Lysobacter sp.]